MVLRGGVAAKTTSVLLTKHLRIVPCLRHWAQLFCGDLDPFWTVGQTSADFSNHQDLTAFGKCISMVHFPFHGKRLVYVPTDQSWPSRNMASSGLRGLEQKVVQARRL